MSLWSHSTVSEVTGTGTLSATQKSRANRPICQFEYP